MASHITTSTHIANFHKTMSHLNYHLNPSLIHVNTSGKWPLKSKNAAILNRALSFIEVKKSEKKPDGSWCCSCNDGAGDAELEWELMDFMAKSEKPTMFPTKDELIRGGRMDLVKAVEERGGWYSLGWDDEKAGDNVEETGELDIEEFQKKVENSKESAYLGENYGDFLCGHEKEDRLSFNSGNLDLGTSSSMDRSIEIGADEDTGIEGILSRLEKQRNIELGIDLEKKGNEAHTASEDEGNDTHFDTSIDVGILNNSNGKMSPNKEPETWRAWSSKRAGLQHTEFEAAEISYSKNIVESDKETYGDVITVTTEERGEALDQHADINHSQIRTRLEDLEFELNTALRFLGSKRDKRNSEEVIGNSNDLQNLPDAYEFHENTLMSADDRLRSIKAKLAILEGKMTLAIIDARKILEEKQKRIDSAHRAIQLLRTTYISWPNSASEVVLVGSFDGWSTQRKMEKSKAGIFSVCLMLYPGRYEMKFIVDGVWKIDPLRPIVKHTGYANNLLIVHE